MGCGLAGARRLRLGRCLRWIDGGDPGSGLGRAGAPEHRASVCVDRCVVAAMAGARAGNRRLAFAAAPMRSDIYVDRAGQGAAIRNASGRLTLVGKTSGFVVEQWLRADGDGRDAATFAGTKEGARCDPRRLRGRDAATAPHRVRARILGLRGGLQAGRHRHFEPEGSDRLRRTVSSSIGTRHWRGRDDAQDGPMRESKCAPFERVTNMSPPHALADASNERRNRSGAARGPVPEQDFQPTIPTATARRRDVRGFQ